MVDCCVFATIVAIAAVRQVDGGRSSVGSSGQPTNIAIVAIAAARQVDGLADGFRGPCIFNNHPACPCSQHSIGEVSFSGKIKRNT